MPGTVWTGKGKKVVPSRGKAGFWCQLRGGREAGLPGREAGEQEGRKQKPHPDAGGEPQAQVHHPP